ncbi:MAG: response regulator [Thermoguttaceae bacterium]|jgi:signal transduction histidine kinase
MSTESIKVLLVEDNLGDARLLYEGLEEALPGQFEMTHVRRLSEAMEYLWEETCNVVLLDLGLPDSHGIDTLVLMRAQAPAVPIVVLTGFQDESLGDQALKEGAQDYLVKGQVDSKLLARSMRYAIARKAATEALIGQGVALAKAGDLQRSRQRLIAVHEHVRRDIAAQLHDGVQDKLLILKGRLQEILKGLGSASETSRPLSEMIDSLNQEIEQQVGILSHRLYPSTINNGLASAFQSFRDQFGAALTIEIELDEELARQEKANRDLLPEQVGLAIYRIAEEALTNVVKHAKAGKVTVRLDPPRVGWLRLTVRDDGQGFDVENAPHGLGLGTMQDYAGAVDGECAVHSAAGAGTEVIAVLPLSQPGAEHLEILEKGDN